MDPNFQPQPNPGSFMSTAAGQPANQGSALMRLMQLRSLGATPQAGATPLPAAPVQTGSPISMRSMDQAAQQSQTQPQPAPTPQMPSGGGSMAPVQPVQAPQTTFDPHGQALQIATQALANYIGNHGKALEAAHEVPRKTAEAKVIAASAQPPASPVS